MTYEDFKDLPRRTTSDKILCHKTFNIVKIPKYDECQRCLASMVYNFFDKRSTSLPDKSAFGSGVESTIMPNQH